ncbi:MAG: bifunctional nuclease domain-containing protein [Streptosporangiaceae bacterium]
MWVSDGELVRLAQAGEPTAFRLLVERYLPVARARASRLCHDPGDVDDVVQESLLQAFLGLDRLRDPDRFAAWLSGIVLNVHRAMRRRPPLTLLAEWPEQLHPVSAGDLPSADDLDRAEALRKAVADLPAGQRRAVTMYYYADLPIGQIADSAGAAKASLHKARQRLREHITAQRPDLIPASPRRALMTAVRIAHAEPRPGDLGDGRLAVNQVLVILADDAGHRAFPVWLNADDGGSLWRLVSPQAGDAALERVPEQLTSRLLSAAGTTVTGVDIDELGPGITAARIGLAGPAGAQHVTARLADGLSLAAAAGCPVRVADSVMDELGVPVTSDDLLTLFLPREPERRFGGRRPHHEPKNLAFADGLARWELTGSYLHHVSDTHWQDYTCTVEGHSAVLRSAVPEPYGFAALRQAVFADDYRGGTIAFRAELRATEVADQAGLFLRVSHGPVRARRDDPDNHLASLAGSVDWSRQEVTAEVPDEESLIIHFGAFLIGRGQVELRNADLSRRT